MGSTQPIRAPLQLEKLSSEELLQHYCQTPEEIYILALWKKLADRKLKWMARRVCPRWYNPEWMIRGSHTRAYKRFCKHISRFIGRLDTPSFAAYLKKLLVSAVVDEDRFVRGQGKKILVQFGRFDVVDDTGTLRRTEREEDADWVEELERAREADVQRTAAEEEGGVEPIEEPSEELTEEVTEEPGLSDAIADLLEKIQPGQLRKPPVQPPRRARRQYVSRRALHLLGALAQPIPRPDAAVSSQERKYIIHLLLLHHLTNEAKANSNDTIVRFFIRDWTKARIAVLIYGEPPDKTAQNRHEKRVKDTLVHDLLSMRKTLKTKFKITTLRQV